METKYGFTKMTIQEFESWIDKTKIARTVRTVQQHHTYLPNYSHFKNNNHFEMQKGMQNHHINSNGWSDIGQHFSTFPDGTILTGRSLETSPACIYGQNSNSICIESIGDFDKGKDVMTEAQKETIVRMTAKLCSKFGLEANSNSIVYHHWFDLKTGERNNGTKNNKSCPGTNFFGGNKVENFNTGFLPLVRTHMKGVTISTKQPEIIKYVCVTSSSLNIRTKPDAGSPKAADREAAKLGAILRVYREQDGWYKISSSDQHWVSAKYTMDVRAAKVTADTLNVRTGPGVSFAQIDQFAKGQEIFIIEQEKEWCKVSMDEKWVSKQYISIS